MATDPIIIDTKDSPLDFKLPPGTMVVINHLNGNQSIVFANERLDDGCNLDACAACGRVLGYSQTATRGGDRAIVHAKFDCTNPCHW